MSDAIVPNEENIIPKPNILTETGGNSNVVTGNNDTAINQTGGDQALKEYQERAVKAAETDSRIDPKLREAVEKQPYARQILASEEEKTAATPTENISETVKNAGGIEMLPDKETTTKLEDLTLRDHEEILSEKKIPGDSLGYGSDASLTDPNAPAASAAPGSEENPETQKEPPTASEQLKTENEKFEAENRQRNINIINTIIEDGKNNGNYFIEIGNDNPDPKLNTKVIIFPKEILHEGTNKILGFSPTHGAFAFDAENIPKRVLNSRFDESEKSKDVRKTSKEELTEDKDGKLSLKIYSYVGKKIESYKLNRLSVNTSLIKEAFTNNRENSEIIKLKKESNKLKEEGNASQEFENFLNDKIKETNPGTTPAV